MGRDDSRERRSTRNRSRSRDRHDRRERHRDDDVPIKKEIKDEPLSDQDSPKRRQGDGDNRRDRRDRLERDERRGREDRREREDRGGRDDRRDREERRGRDDRRDREDRDQRGFRGDRRDREDRDGRRDGPSYHRDQRDEHRERRGNFRERSRSRERVREDGKKYGLETKQENWGKSEEPTGPPKEKEKVNLGVSGALTEDTNTFRGVVIKYNEPPEAKKPNARWRLYPFKGEEALQVLYIHRQSAYLIGRDHKIADIPVDHPSCSKQHAVLQFRSMPFTRDDGTKARRIMPYVIDLGSGNGTFLNEQKIEPQRYIELKEKDMLKFGFSTREYVVMKEREITEDELAGTGDVKQEAGSDSD